MSALGQKQACAVQNGMSALPLKATSNATYWNICFGPKADIAAFGVEDGIGYFPGIIIGISGIAEPLCRPCAG
jgi:hypothetical protein